MPLLAPPARSLLLPLLEKMPRAEGVDERRARTEHAEPHGGVPLLVGALAAHCFGQITASARPASWGGPGRRLALGLLEPPPPGSRTPPRARFAGSRNEPDLPKLGFPLLVEHRPRCDDAERGHSSLTWPQVGHRARPCASTVGALHRSHGPGQSGTQSQGEGFSSRSTAAAPTSVTAPLHLRRSSAARRPTCDAGASRAVRSRAVRRRFGHISTSPLAPVHLSTVSTSRVHGFIRAATAMADAGQAGLRQSGR